MTAAVTGPTRQVFAAAAKVTAVASDRSGPPGLPTAGCYREDEVIGQPITTLIEPLVRSTSREPIASSASFLTLIPHAGTIETLGRRQDGSRLALEVTDSRVWPTARCSPSISLRRWRRPPATTNHAPSWSSTSTPSSGSTTRSGTIRATVYSSSSPIGSSPQCANRTRCSAGRRPVRDPARRCRRPARRRRHRLEAATNLRNRV